MQNIMWRRQINCDIIVTRKKVNMDEQDELVPATDDDDSLSENEDNCLPDDKLINSCRHNLIYVEHTKLEFIVLKIVLILSTLAVLIIYPLYVATVNVKGNVYSLLFTNTLLSMLVLINLTVALKYLFPKYKYIQLLRLPISLPKLVSVTFIYFLSAIIITYAVDRKRVVCHLQDPLKQLIVVFSFLYYFVFCQRFMCLQRIFSITVIIVGLFIALDYSLCNEFKCRGYERMHVSDETGNWSWKTHAVWTSVYVGGLALFAGYFTALEQSIIGVIEMIQKTYSAPFLNTVSRSVSADRASTSNEDGMEEPSVYKKINVVHLAMWLHVIGFLMVVFLLWTDYIPQIGKGSNGSVVLNYTINGIRCHFSSDPSCKNLAIISWLFLLAYLGFVVTSIQFLILTQSAVYTVATMSTALPLTGIWWSLVPMISIDSGLLMWQPTFSGDVISSLLGLPIVIIGLYFLHKSHYRDWEWSKRITEHPAPASLAT